MHSRRIVALAVSLAFLGLFAGIVLAQSIPIINRWVLGGGGDSAMAVGGVSLSSVLGQPIAGVSSGGDVILLSGFWSGGRPKPSTPSGGSVYLPLALRNHIYTWEDCGDAKADACQISGCGTVLSAYPDDENDWYYFDLGTTQNLTVRLAGSLPTSQLLLYDVAGNIVAHDGSSNSTKSVSHSLQNGYVRVFTAYPYSGTNLYTLTLICQ